MANNKKTASSSDSRESRRLTLKALGIGTVVGSQALPEQWMKPVVSSILMPAHAQTSPAQTPGFECAFEFSDLLTEGGEAEGEASILFNAGVVSEAANNGIPASFIVRNPGVELDGSVGDFVVSASTEGSEGFYFVETDIGTESEVAGTVFTVDLDIDNDDDIDCSDSTTAAFFD